jgi:endonuclease/exonuclease/phosphatase family metal-dependent hydrolase
MMRVMTWNLWWQFGPWRERAVAISAVVREQVPDILLLQEVWGEAGTSSAHEIAAALGFHVAITDDTIGGRNQAGIHNAIVSRWPLCDVVSHPLPRLNGAAGHRRAVRQVQAEALLRIVDGLRTDPDTDPPVVIGGDFNAVPDADEIRLLNGRRAAPVHNLVLTDCWDHVGDGPGVTWRSDNPYQAHSAWPNRRLDYVFVSWPRPKPLGNPRRAWLAGVDPVDGIWASDHAAVVVELHDERG